MNKLNKIKLLPTAFLPKQKTRLASKDYLEIVQAALLEDASTQDITTQTLINPELQRTAHIIAKEKLTIAGLNIARAVFKSLDPQLKIKVLVQDGAELIAGASCLQVSGKAQSILSAERVALNFLQRLSGISTYTATLVKLIENTKAKILDTRKTTPLWRSLERYAVCMGGGFNHRFDLKSGIMIKDNHWACMGSREETWKKISDTQFSRKYKKLPLVWEVENIAELKQALHWGIQWIQLDNMKVSQLRQAVQITQGRAVLEATGGITKRNIQRIADTGVDFISMGALTHSAPAVDFSLEITR